jgi:hypothetical protein
MTAASSKYLIGTNPLPAAALAASVALRHAANGAGRHFPDVAERLLWDGSSADFLVCDIHDQTRETTPSPYGPA